MAIPIHPSITADQLKAGQVWYYTNRENEVGATITINLIEQHPSYQAIYHISLNDLAIPAPPTPQGTGIISHIPHIPVTQEALLNCITTLAGYEEPDPEWEHGYNTWKSAFYAGKAGVFSVSITEIINTIERSLQPVH